MCGINGIFLKDRDRSVDRSAVLLMRDSMAHRGPDDEGILINQNVGLGHRRLSIIGLKTGQQPMTDSSGKLWIVYNGETYNYAALKESLQDRGYQFQTESDTEVVLNLYAEYGPLCVEHMNGLFAFAIWDSSSRQLFIARDRLGIKPLYFLNNSDSFVFASEIKAVMQSGHYSSSIDVTTVYEYFMFRAVSGHRTMFEGIRSLPPGHRMVITEKSTNIEQYWSASTCDSTGARNIDNAVDQLDELLTDAVRIRLMSEVPLGTFCSGGVDSSLVTALAARARGSSINTFSVGFKEKEYDESHFARVVSEMYATKHHEIQIDGREFANLLPSLVRLNDEPLNFANSVHIFAVSILAKDYVTVVLTGEGADELFLGYPRYNLPQIAQKLDWIAAVAGPALSAVKKIFNDHRFKKLSANLSMPASDRILFSAAANEIESIDKLLDKSLPRDLDYRRNLVDSLSRTEDILRQVSINDQNTYLVSILNRQDKMSMAASVEARVPFLDYRIVEFANQLPSSVKQRGLITKRIVKKLASRYLPNEVIHRRKSGFGVPLRDYFEDKVGLGQLATHLIYDTEYTDFLDKSWLVYLLKSHQSGEVDNSELLWTAVNFLLWKEEYRV